MSLLAFTKAIEQERVNNANLSDEWRAKVDRLKGELEAARSKHMAGTSALVAEMTKKLQTIDDDFGATVAALLVELDRAQQGIDGELELRDKALLHLIEGEGA
jgi:uncharacterized membrane-anchored protein YhcB (DUF1043 family)